MFVAAPLTVTFVARGRVRLETPLWWQDADGSLVVPAGFVSDGASIPALAWPFVGHPYSGSLLPAALLHDWDIRQRTSPWATVQRRFYRALRASGVGRVRAALLFAGVWIGVPRW